MEFAKAEQLCSRHFYLKEDVMRTEGTTQTEKELYLRGFAIDWDKIDSDSYLHGIAPVRNIDALQFHRPVTFFAGENGSASIFLTGAMP